MKVVILTRYPKIDRLKWKRLLVESLLQQGEKPVIIYGDSSYYKHFKAGLKRYGFKSALKMKLGRGKETHGDLDPGFGEELLLTFLKQRGLVAYCMKDLNSNSCSELLVKLSPDIIVLAGTPIMRKKILDIPRIGSINGHYAMLPHYRGMDVTEWSILNDDRVGATVHFVNHDVDRGDIISSEVIPVFKGDRIVDVRERCRHSIVKQIVVAIKKIEEGSLKTVKQNPNEGRQFYTMNQMLIEVVKKKLEGGHYRHIISKKSA